MTEIAELTPQQESALANGYAQWLAVGRNTEPLDQEAARSTVQAFYARLGKPAPRLLTFSSPAMCLLAWQELRARSGESFAPIGAQLWSRLGSELWSRLGAQLSRQLPEERIARLKSRFESPLGGQLASQIGAHIEGELRDGSREGLARQLREQLEAQLGDSLTFDANESITARPQSHPSDRLGAQHWCWWEAFYDLMRSAGAVYDPDAEELLELWLRQARTLHWWLPCEGFALLSERHTELHLDEDGRLHAENGPACAYADGWALWAWHGARVSRHTIEAPERLTVAQIAAESNPEAQRVMAERMGWNRYCTEARVRVLHCDELHSHFPDIPVSAEVEPGLRLVTHYRPGVERAELIEAVDLTDFDRRPLRFVRLQDPSTGHPYTLRVRHDHTRCYEAVGWTFAQSESEYKHGRFLRQGDVFLKPLQAGPTRQTHS